MDNNLQRLKQELDSLWQSDEGLHTQMNSVIGALQELKLLQVQTALEKLDFSIKPSQISPLTSAPNTQILDRNKSSSGTNLNQTQNQENLCYKNEFGMDSSIFLSSSPLENRNIPRAQAPMRINYRGSLSTSSSFSSSHEDTIDSSCDNDDSTDWTASLMNHSRNRQPLVLGDNAFADLVGNWLDLPDVGYQTAGEEVDDSRVKDTSIESSPTSHSQEFSRRLSLTANIFKRILRRARPGRGKPQDYPGELHQGSEGMEVFKQPKITCRKPKGNASKPFWARTRGLRKKTTPIQQEGVACQSSGGLIGWPETVDEHHRVFDYSSAEWV
ncbi:PAK4-inhibitor INKA2 [Triplophysa tibetana]|uniref:PAK4-inhibitor INKA2 n=1 Tax=Triplophysa tibetana TaxID=1572043 RepID=A0A5A9NZY0_9TELE|nr:PAK4-inhibitor INKA2 [Triplophysa tibetana]